jgi:Protein of unknown function (DUF1549)/Protein of unknown function (DUF1553)
MRLISIGFSVVMLLASASAHAQERDPLRMAAEIDRLVERGLTQANVPASPSADDAEFLRRVTLDITGRIPTYDETIAFLDSTTADKRRRLVNRLLDSPAYGQHFATIWNELIVPRDKGSTKTVRDPFTPWLAEQFNQNRGWDVIVRELLTAEGKLRDKPETGFIAANCENFEPQPNLLADATARLFLGIQLRCAECHDHPFAPWKQSDFWELAAFFSHLRKGYSDGKNPAGWTYTESPPDDPISQKFSPSFAAPGVAGAALVVPVTGGKLAGQVVRARLLAGAELPANGEQPFRPRLAAWVTGSDNRWFAANAANRLWADFFGRGLVQPLDGFSADRPPEQSELLTLLAKELADSAFDVKHLIRAIVSSQAYQRTSRALPANKSDSERFSHMAVKPLRPEMLYDAISIVLYPPVPKSIGKPNTALQLLGLPKTSRDEFVRSYAMRPDETVGSEVNTGVPQFLQLLNSELLNQESPGLTRLLRGEPAPADAIESLYLAALSRRPTAEERRWMLDYIAENGDQRAAYGGVLWTLLNSGEFVLNH